MGIGVEQFGRDHWSTLGYIETRITDYGGRLLNGHMRCDPSRHPMFAHLKWAKNPSTFPTRLKNGVDAPNHDDWDCADDLEEAGILENVGTGVNRVYLLTPRGRPIADGLREHKRKNLSFATFDPSPFLVLERTG